ncbi:MAG: hypothetical protein QOC95_1954, partial [Thermoleophilaceae bacterium]|nr:hypothetical protein [Thermoleophilaceae bacterium]
MRHVLAGVGAAAALLLGAPAAMAATLTVTGTGDSAGPCTGNDCPTLRSALTQAATTPEADTIQFADSLSGATITVGSTLPSPGRVDIVGGGDTTVAQSASAAGPLLLLSTGSAGSTVRDITLVGPGSAGAASTSLIRIAASSITVAGSTLRNATGAGVEVASGSQQVTITQNSIYGYGTNPVTFESSDVNGGIHPPANLRVGPRNADGTLPVSGTTDGVGGLEFFGGPQRSFFFGAGVGGGAFSFVPTPEPAAGDLLGITITDGAGNTSEYANVRVPDDTASPFIVGAVATTLNAIDVQMSEPVDPATVQTTDFFVQMTAVTRPITGAFVSPDGTRITLTSSKPWGSGEAGIVRLTQPGAIADPAGNASLAPVERHVGGAPGDFIAPVVTNFRLNPNRGVCFVEGPRCKHPRTAVIFNSSEEGDMYITVFRGKRLIGERRYTGHAG